MKILRCLWLFALIAALILFAETTLRNSSRSYLDFPSNVDEFGYLYMAREIRTAAHEKRLPDFSFRAEQAALLIDFMKSQNVDLRLWDDLVAPQASHYFPVSGQNGVQYPPGTGLLLSIFPAGHAVRGLNRATVFILLSMGVVALIWAATRGAWLSTGLVALAVHLALDILGRIDTRSFSINAVIMPLCLTVAAIIVGRAGRNRKSIILSFTAGALFGFSFLSRLAVAFLAPGLVCLQLHGRRRLQKILAFAAGASLTGLIPLLIHQHRLAGAWYLSTYNRQDNSRPGLDFLGDHLTFYLGKGAGAGDMWAIFYGALSAFFLLRTIRSETRKNLGLAAFITFAVPTFYFLTHRLAMPYYAIPASLAVVWILACGALREESSPASTSSSHASTSSTAVKSYTANVLVTLAILLPGFLVIQRGWQARPQGPAHGQENAPPPALVLPDELKDPKAWIWADLTPGTIWYFEKKCAFKIAATDDSTREKIFSFVRNRNEPQFVIDDSVNMPAVLDQIRKIGGRLEPRGKVGTAPYYALYFSSMPAH